MGQGHVSGLDRKSLRIAVDILARMVVRMDHRPVANYGIEIGIGKVLRHQAYISYNSQRRVPQAWSQDKNSLALPRLIQKVIK